MKQNVLERIRQNTLIRRVFVPIMILVVVESVLFFGVVTDFNLLPQLEEKTRETFESKVENRARELETQMSGKWSDLMPDFEDITAKVDDLEKTGAFDPEKIGTGGRDDIIVLTEIADSVVDMLRGHSVTGAYVLLGEIQTDADENNCQMTGLYITDSNVQNNNSITNSDLQICRGPSKVVEAMGIATAYEWMPKITLEGETFDAFARFYETSDRLSEAGTQPKDMGYWFSGIDLGNDQVISYAIPYVRQGKTLGVIGVEVSREQLRKKLDYQELDSTGRGTYCLLFEENGIYTNLFTSNPYYATEWQSGKNLEFEQIKNHIHTEYAGEIIETSMSSLQLYSNNSPYEGEHWYLAGMVEENHLLSFLKKVKGILLISMMLSLFLGFIFSFLISFWVSRPVTALAGKIRRMNFRDQLEIERTNIIEIDQLIDAIEYSANQANAATHRVTKIIKLANTEIEGFELDYEENQLFVTPDFFRPFGLDLDAGDMDVETFKKVLHSFDDKCRVSSAESRNEYIYHLEIADKPVYLRLCYSHDQDSKKYYGLIEEVSELMKERNLIEYERDHDVLTGLINRRAYQRQMKRLFTMDFDKIKVGALLMMDLDNLKVINDELGHEAGDAYIRGAAQTFSEVAPENAILSRISGDEFNVFFYGYDTREEVEAAVELFFKALSNKTLKMPNCQMLQLHVSGGVAWYPDDSRDFELLQKYSDFAMYQVKRSSKGILGHFSKDEYQNGMHMSKRKAELEQVLRTKSLTYHFQPIVDGKTGEIFAYEALMRPVNSILSGPAELIEIAKVESKLYMIESITMTMGIELFHRLLEEEKVPKDCKLFINSISNQRLSEEDIVTIEREHGNILDHIVLELTENEELDRAYTMHKREVLARWHAGTALDDYGSGYNSGRNLLAMNPDFVKIDLDITRDIDKDVDKRAIVADTTEYCHKRGKKVIAEGIETIAELRTVIDLGVDYIQGYLLGRPAAVPEVAEEQVRMEICNLNKNRENRSH